MGSKFVGRERENLNFVRYLLEEVDRGGWEVGRRKGREYID